MTSDCLVDLGFRWRRRGNFTAPLSRRQAPLAPHYIRIEETVRSSTDEQRGILLKLQDVFRNDIRRRQHRPHGQSTNTDDIEKWDSLNQVRIILACQQVFNAKVNARKVNTLENVGQMVEYLAAALK